MSEDWDEVCRWYHETVRIHEIVWTILTWPTRVVGAMMGNRYRRKGR